MNKRRLMWMFSGVLYLLFCAWYTDLGGALTETEIAEISTKLKQNGLSDERIARLQVFLRNDSGRQFLMLNAIDYNENPPDVAGASPGESAPQLMDRYMEHMFRELLLRACHPVIMGPAVFGAVDLVGMEQLGTASEWDMGAFMRYRSRRSFAEIITNPATLERHEFKIAALDKTIAYPVETQLYLGDLRLIVGLLLLSATALLDILIFGRRRS
jgi:hypothetical protein